MSYLVIATVAVVFAYIHLFKMMSSLLLLIALRNISMSRVPSPWTSAKCLLLQVPLSLDYAIAMGQLLLWL